MDVSVAELKKPLILPPPEGASFLSSWTRVITPGDSACTRLHFVGKFGRLWIFFYLRRGDSRKQEQPEETPSIAKRCQRGSLSVEQNRGGR